MNVIAIWFLKRAKRHCAGLASLFLTLENSMTAENVMPAFVRAADVAHALGVTRECVYATVKVGKLPAYEFCTRHTRGWSRTSLLNVRPDLFQILADYFADKKAAA